MHTGRNQRACNPDVTQQIEIIHIPHAPAEDDRMIRARDRITEKIEIDAGFRANLRQVDDDQVVDRIPCQPSSGR